MVVLIYFSLMFNNVEHVFMCLLLSVYLLGCNVFSCFLVCFLMYSLLFYCWALKVLYVFQENTALTEMLFKNIFSQSVAYLFIILTGSLAKQKFKILMKSSLSIFPFMNHTSSAISQNFLPSPSSWRFSLVCFSESYSFTSYI